MSWELAGIFVGNATVSFECSGGSQEDHLYAVVVHALGLHAVADSLPMKS